MTGEITDRYPLSAVQQGMLFHHVHAPNSGAYIQQVVFTLLESVDSPRLKKAWHSLLNRHGALRTSFHCLAHEAPVQKVHATASLRWQELDWSTLETSCQEVLFSELLTAERRDFDLSDAPLMRLACCRFGPTESRLVWTFHHILADGRSRLLLAQEVFAHYQMLKDGVYPYLPDPVPYSKYINWLEQQDFRQAKTFWKNLLQGYMAPTPLNLGRPSGESHGRNVQEDKLSPDLTAALKEFATQNDLTLNTVVQIAWAFLLSRYSGENDIVFGTTRACRKSTVAGSESMIGLLINTVPVRVSIGAGGSVLDCLKALRGQWLAVREYEHTPLKLIQGWSDVPAGKPLFETIVVFEHSHFMSQLRALGNEWTHRSIQVHQQTHYPLTLEAYGDVSLLLRLEYSQARFDDASMQRMLSHLKNICQEILAKPTEHPSELELLTPDESHQLLHQHSHSALKDSSFVDQSSTLHQAFEAQTSRTPDDIAVTCEGISITYRELNARADQLANRLQQLGVGPEVVVGLYLERSIGLVTSLLAILKAGGAYLPIDLAYPTERIGFMLNDAQAPIVLTQSNLAASLPAIHAKVVCIDTDWTFRTPVSLRKSSAEAGPDNVAYVIYTSGSTGTPKGVLVTHRNVFRLFAATADSFKFSEHDVWTLFHSCAFDFSVWEIWGALLHGGRLVVVPYLTSRSPEQFYQLLAQERVTVLNQTPSAFRQLIVAEEAIGPSDLALRFVIFGGEALEMQSLKPWFDRHGDDHPQLVNMYGITETTVHVTYRRLSKRDLTAGSIIGKPIPDLQVYILDEKRRPVPLGVPGEIYVGGAGLARGYLNQPQLSEERFIPNMFSDGRLYKTGDLARFRGDGDIEYLGRIDHQVKIRGFRIELGEIESVLSAQPGVRDAVVVAREDKATGIRRLVGYVAAAQPWPLTSQLRQSLKKQLPDHMVPAVFVVLDALPLTNNGKVDRKALPAPDPHREDLVSHYVPPETTTQKKLAAIWGQVLQVEQVGNHDNFFELGGDSILSIQVVAKARQAGLTITPKMLFENQSIVSLAAAVDTSTRSMKEFDDLETGSFPLAPVQHWFFEQDLAGASHYNQALLLTISEPLHESAFRQALECVKQHHGSLRLCFRKHGALWDQSYCKGDNELSFERIDLSEKTYVWQATAIEEIAKSRQCHLQIDGGPLSRVVYFDLGRSWPSRVLFVIHHLLIDGVSWRILLEDLETAYRQALEGQNPILPAKTASFASWVNRLLEYANSDDAIGQRDYWIEVNAGETTPLPTDHCFGDNTEGSTGTLTVTLSVEETQKLLQRVPSAFKTQINDVLVAALVKSLATWTGYEELFFSLEGHGREDVGDELDVTRTIGWFTSIFPVRLRIDSGLVRGGKDWDPVGLLTVVKSHLRRVPLRGLGYGILRYLTAKSPLPKEREPEITFNYLGQLDSMSTSSTLFTFAPEPTGPSHSPNQKRRYLLEVNGAVIGGRLKVDWTFSKNRHETQTVERLAGDFIAALRRVLDCCESTEIGDVAHDASSQLQPQGLSMLSERVVDVYPLSPMQTLFFTLASARPEALVDQWHCTLEGELDVPAFQKAWAEAIKHNAVLRSTFDGEASAQPMQRVHSAIYPDWTLEDWSAASPEDQTVGWNSLLAADSKQSFVLSKPPLMRFALRQIGERSHRFLWTLPALLVDGWSWPLVFQSVAQAYESFRNNKVPNLQHVRQFSDYIDWLQELDWSQPEAFWRSTLHGFRQPTRLSLGGAGNEQSSGAAFQRLSCACGTETSKALVTLARTLHVTLSTLIQACWALILARRSSSNDVVFGVAFSGRPATLSGAENIVGPFVSNLPVRVRIDAGASLQALLIQVHTQSLESSQHQFASPLQVQEWSEVSAPDRLFESLLVIQNYQVNELAVTLGPTGRLNDFVGPIHSNFDVTVVVTPGERLKIELVFNPTRLDREIIQSFAKDLEGLLALLPVSPTKPLRELQASLCTPALSLQSAQRSQLRWTKPAPQSDTERKIVMAWQEVLGIDCVGVEDNILETGAHSLTIVKLHLRLQATLGINLPIVRMFQYPTARSLAQHLEGALDDSQDLSNISERARQQRDALSQIHEAHEVRR